MNCPNCGYNFKIGNICPNCNMDTYLYKKTKNTSIKLYNKSLELVKISDLSGAEKLLEHSIAFDKYNIEARNLLGLVYFEKGKIGSALKQWIISSSIKKGDNPAIKYMDKVNKNARKMDKMNDAVHMYNQAILHIHQHNDDLAVIQLKKALGLSPKFIDAYNLLALCYINIKKYSLAKKCIDKALKIDKHNETSLRYMSEIEGFTRYSNKSKNKKNNEKRADNLTYEEHNKKFSVIGKGEIIAFLTGAICIGAVILILLLPSMVDTREKEIEQLKAQLNTNSQNQTQNKNDIEQLQIENESLKEQIAKYENQALYQENLLKLSEAQSLYDSKDYTNAALKLFEVKTDYFSEDEKNTYNEIKENVYSKAAESFYNDGKVKFINNNYTEAQSSLENCLKFASGENFVDDALYYLGKISENASDFEKAKTYYNKIISEFANSNQYKNAENSLKNISNSQ